MDTASPLLWGVAGAVACLFAMAILIIALPVATIFERFRTKHYLAVQERIKAQALAEKTKRQAACDMLQAQRLEALARQELMRVRHAASQGGRTREMLDGIPSEDHETAKDLAKKIKRLEEELAIATRRAEEAERDAQRLERQMANLKKTREI